MAREKEGRRRIEKRGKQEGGGDQGVPEVSREGFTEGRGRLGMTLGGWNFRGLARFAGVRSGELQCRARRRQTSVRATRLRFYATLCLYPCLLTGLTPLFILLFLRDLQPRLFRASPYPLHATPPFSLFLTSISPTFISSTLTPQQGSL